MKTPEEIVKDYTTYLGGLSVIYEDKVVEMMYEYAQESSTQVRENLSYYIGLADRYYQENEIVRAERDELQKNYEMVLFERDEAREKLVEGHYSIEYVQQLKNQVKGLEEKVADLLQEIKDHY